MQSPNEYNIKIDDGSNHNRFKNSNHKKIYSIPKSDIHFNHNI
jgi:hypothetical protein